MGMGVARTAKRNFSGTGTYFGVRTVHYQLIPSEQPFEFSCGGIFAKLTALSPQSTSDFHHHHYKGF